MRKLLLRFRAREDGAVTVDWVVLTAAIVGLAILATPAIRDSTFALRDDASAELASQIGQ